MDTEPGTNTSVSGAPVACSLTDKAAAEQVLEWVDLRNRATEVSEHEGGVRMTFSSTLSESVEDLARRERACCAFLTLTTTVVGDLVTLDISSRNPEALPVISALAGLPAS